MKRILLGLFYTLQGIGNLSLALLILSRPSYALGFGAFLLGASILSFITVWSLFEKNVDPTSLEGLGTLTSVFFIVLYGILIGMPAYSNIELGYYVYPSFILLLVYLGIVVLNVVSMIGLYSFAESKRIRD